MDSRILAETVLGRPRTGQEPRSGPRAEESSEERE